MLHTPKLKTLFAVSFLSAVLAGCGGVMPSRRLRRWVQRLWPAGLTPPRRP